MTTCNHGWPVTLVPAGPDYPSAYRRPMAYGCGLCPDHVAGVPRIDHGPPRFDARGVRREGR